MDFTFLNFPLDERSKKIKKKYTIKQLIGRLRLQNDSKLHNSYKS